MNIIFKEILFQKLKEKPNRKFIRRLQNYVDNTDEMTLEDFQSFGRFMSRWKFLDEIMILSEFRSKNLNQRILLPDCSDVLVYLDGFYIQVLKDNTFYKRIGDEEMQSKDITEVEEFYWNKHVYKYKQINYGKD